MKDFMEDRRSILNTFGTDEARGLTAEQVLRNRIQFGENSWKKAPPVPLWRRIFSAMSEPMMLILILAGLIAFGVNLLRSFSGSESDFLECAGILIAIALCVLITVLMEGRSAKAFEALSKMSADLKVRVIRGGVSRWIPQSELVAGDLVVLSSGDKIPADGRLLNASDFRTDESALTGESHSVRKNPSAAFSDPRTPLAERINMVYAGCFAVSGTAEMVVTAVGDQTEFGRIAGALSAQDKSSTPLQEKLARLGRLVTGIGASAAFLVFAVQCFRIIRTGTGSIETFSEAFISAIVLIVATVPEGLPTIVAVSLSINMIKLARQNALVKKMVACETIGCINVICSDKTGTLTENRMSVVSVYENTRETAPDSLRDPFLIRNFFCNSTADVSREEHGVKFIGNPTECALLAAAVSSGFDERKIRESETILHRFPFSSDLKYMTTQAGTPEHSVLYLKGAPEKILSRCTLSGTESAEVSARIRMEQDRARRVIAFAHRELHSERIAENNRADLESGLHFDGFAAIADPLRKEVFEAVMNCRTAGIDLKILTGDNLATASAIASELGISDPAHSAVEARSLEELDEAEFRRILPSIRVIARSTPGVKMRVVKALKAMGCVVAVTGDGINDAPAIQNADVGISMGITGTEVSKEASDIVLLDDSFATIVKAVEWGRSIYENFQRVIQFQLTVNVSSVLVVLISILAGFPPPFTALQLLWINLIMDGPPALTLGLEPLRDDLMRRRPTPRDAGIISSAMAVRILLGGCWITAVILMQEHWNFLGVCDRERATVLFTLFVLFQLVNAFNSRELSTVSVFKSLMKNHWMLTAFGGVLLLQFTITQFGGAFFGTVPLSAAMWGKLFLVSASILAASELVKLLVRAARSVFRNQEFGR